MAIALPPEIADMSMRSRLAAASAPSESFEAGMWTLVIRSFVLDSISLRGSHANFIKSLCMQLSARFLSRFSITPTAQIGERFAVVGAPSFQAARDLESPSEGRL